MGYYNDHHFHFGYFVYAASVIAKSDSNWVNTYGDAVLSLIRDYSNPASGNGDPNFTFMRNKDWFVGHSWAAGIFPFADGRNQESSSESVNAWYAVSLYGLATGNERIKDLGRLALASEIRFDYLLFIDHCDSRLSFDQKLKVNRFNGNLDHLLNWNMYCRANKNWAFFNIKFFNT